MSEHCTVHLTRQAERDLARLAKRDPKRFLILEAAIGMVEENGWVLSVTSALVKVLREPTRVGEIRDIGKGGYRMFFFWHDRDSARQIWICRVTPKQSVVGRARLNDICNAVEKLRERFLEEER
jgi:hypothetical protein